MAESRRSDSAGEASRQRQFLNVVSRQEATSRFRQHLHLEPVGAEDVSLSEARHRVLAEDIRSPVDVPAFDRSNVDGFAMVAADTFGAQEEAPVRVRPAGEVIAPGVFPETAVRHGQAVAIATGGMLPRGADCVVMIEHTDLVEQDGETWVEISRSAVPGQFVTFAGTDVANGEAVAWTGQLLSSREIGVLAAIGRERVRVYRRPRVAVISTGDEIVPPGQPLPTGCVYDSNAAILSAAVEELGGEPVPHGSIPDNEEELQQALEKAMTCDVVVLSGGTSKGAGDLSYRVVERLGNPGIVAHGVALKPGKPVCLAVTDGKPVVILPGFPTSAIFTFHEFVAPVIRALAGLPIEERPSIKATLPVRVNSDRGRLEYLLVGLVGGGNQLAAYPMGKGSGSVTTFSLADGFIRIDEQTEIVEPGAEVTVTLLDREMKPADLVVIGSHCVGLDTILGRLRREGLTIKTMHVGSLAGLNAARRGECDLAGMHLLDPGTGEYNRPFVTDELELVQGYRRLQCLVFRPGDGRFESKPPVEAVKRALADSDCMMINRNSGSGTRALIDRLLEDAGASRDQPPPGYGIQAKSHNAVAAAVRQGRADWGVAIDRVANDYGLAATPLQDEHYDFVIPRERRGRPAVQRFRELLDSPAVKQELSSLGFRPAAAQ
ncbi:Molybdopterin molybdenumtransferase [Maioricimonas rarisocia]|uniref:Molybdopterin molybdenumtransferase n=1 Tax=Maioricimonas rarisocia TaxID=2528026 RepID=A0A517Z8E9_9PLAN|nr:molybdopterin biosynthesis protein [Maioricimonas rarisocia]QDU38754.1 Molybdopterin molybdenumtransferase [Maioricimonas rarisocia]